MTTQQPEALRLAQELDAVPETGADPQTIQEAAAELRRLHAYCQELEAQVILDCMTHDQNPAEIEHVAGVVSKNGAELNMTGSAMRASHGQAPAIPECLTCNDHGAVGNILTAEPCPDCTRKAAPAAVAGPHVTDAMALAFHSALSDGAIGSDEVEETKAGLRAALAASPTAVNRYCRAGMCVPSDTKHEPWCTAHRDREIESLRARSVAPAGEYPALPDDSEAFNAAWQIASHGHAQAAPQPSPAAQGDALSDDAVRVPLDSLHADAAYLIGRLREGTMPYARVIEIIRERIDAAKAAIRARAAQDDALDAARYRWLREGNDAKHGAAWHVAVNLYGCEWDAAIDAARAAQEGKSHE